MFIMSAITSISTEMEFYLTTGTAAQDYHRPPTVLFSPVQSQPCPRLSLT